MPLQSEMGKKKLQEVVDWIWVDQEMFKKKGEILADGSVQPTQAIQIVKEVCCIL